MENKSQIILYQTEDGKTRVEVRFEHENVWLTQKLMAELFGTTKQNISLHLQNIFKEQELSQVSVVKDFLTTAADGKKYNVKMYGLEAVVAVGYRVNSDCGTFFRQWATERLKEYMVKGFTMDDARLKQGGYQSRYFEELLPHCGCLSFVCRNSSQKREGYDHEGLDTQARRISDAFRKRCFEKRWYSAYRRG